MDDFETNPAGAADLVARLRDYEEYEQSRDGQIICVKSDMAQEAADCIEQLEAALTRANAATAAAYEVAAQIADDFVRMREQQIETEKSKSALHVDVPQIMRWQAGKVQSKATAAAIRALATPDQTAALEKLIAEAVAPYVEALIWCSGSPDFNDGGFARKGWQKLCAPLILAASKKGGV